MWTYEFADHWLILGVHLEHFICCSEELAERYLRTKPEFRLHFMSFELIFKILFIDEALRHFLSCNYSSSCCEWEGDWELELREEN